MMSMPSLMKIRQFDQKSLAETNIWT